ncbi:MAG: hypothetical protein ACP5NQ_06830 [Vulcanisaeta sp.]
MRILINAFRDLQPIAVIGHRRLGKSSLLNVALRLVSDDFITVKVSLESVRTIRQFLDLYADSVLTEAMAESFKLRVRAAMTSVRDYLHELLGAVREVGVRVSSFEFYVRLYSDTVRVIIESELRSLTQAQLAMLRALARGIKVTKSGVNKPSRVLNELINKGLIERRGRGNYVIIDQIIRSYLTLEFNY